VARAVDGAVRTEIPDGLRLILPTERAGAVATLAAAE
jgi:MerR family copper efflux transcriptional regulator